MVAQRPRSNSYNSRKRPRFISNANISSRNRAMSFVPRSLGNPRAITERKFWDTNVQNKVITTVTGTFNGALVDPTTQNSLLSVVTGGEAYNRQGRVVSVHKISIRGRLVLPAVSNVTTIDVLQPLIVRVILCIDKQTNGTQMNSQDLIGAGTGTTGDAIDMHQNPAFFGRFQVLKDKTYVLQDANTFAEQNFVLDRQGVAKLFKWNVKFRKPVLVHYNNVNVGTIGDIVDNSFHMLAACQTPSNSTQPEINYRSRIIFTDP